MDLKQEQKTNKQLLDSIGGWLKTAYSKMVSEYGTIAMPMRDDMGRIYIFPPAPLRLIHRSVEELYKACEVAAQGQVNKEIVSVENAGAAIALPTTERAFGCVLRVADSMLAANYRPFLVNFAYNGLQVNAEAFPSKPIFEMIFLTIGFDGGLGRVVPTNNLTVNINGANIRLGATVTLETLTARDL